MSAAITDYFNKASDMNGVYPSVATVNATRSAGATTLACDDLGGWATDTPVHFSTFQVGADGEIDTSTQTDWKGIVSGNSITNLVRLAGAADSGNTAGDRVELNPTIGWLDDLITGLLVSHLQDGTLKDGIVSTSKIADGAVSTAKMADDSVTSEKIADGAIDSSSQIADATILARNLDFSSIGRNCVAVASVSGSASVSITPKVSGGIIEVEAVSGYTWGYAGGTVKLELNTPSGLSRIAYHRGAMTGGDLEGRQMVSNAVYTGAQAGTTYTFTSNATGQFGVNPDSILIVRYFPGS